MESRDFYSEVSTLIHGINVWGLLGDHRCPTDVLLLFSLKARPVGWLQHHLSSKVYHLPTIQLPLAEDTLVHLSKNRHPGVKFSGEIGPDFHLALF